VVFINNSRFSRCRLWSRSLVAAVKLRPAGRFRLCMLFLLLCTAALVQDSVADDVAPLRGASASGTLEARLEADISYLASDELRGRDIGSEGLELAAQYIARSFTDAGLETQLFDGGPFQTFSIPLGVSVGEADSNWFEINVAPKSETPKTTTYELGQLFRPLAIGDSSLASGPIAFVGYGITAPDKGYDDYAGLDTNGLVVLMIRKEPTGPVADKLFDGAQNSRHAYFETKIKNAATHGAAAVLLVNDEESIARMTQSVARQIEAESNRLDRLDRQFAELPAEATNIRERQSTRRGEIVAMIEDLQRQKLIAAEGVMEVGEAGVKTVVEGMPVLSVSWSLASELLATATGRTLRDVKQSIDDQVKPQSAVLNAVANLQTSLSPAEAPSSNVLGVLLGRGSLADETVIIGAHYDHVGMGGPGSLAPGTVAIHNGADDNASGTSVLLSSVHIVRELLSEHENHRRVLFIAFTGEERGLLGSEHYVRNPRFPLENTVAMINLDMVGRLRNNDLTVYGTGTAPGFDELVDRANEQTGFSLFKVASGYGPSDHQSFYMRKVPVLFFFTGLHADYHRPSDTIAKINLNGMARITDMTSIVAAEVAVTPERPQYATTERDVKVRQQSRTYLGVSLQDAPERADDSDEAHFGEPPGVIVSAVAAGSPAELAGIHVGDRLLRVDGVALRSLGQLIEVVAEREVDEILEISLDRAGTVMSVSARLQRRPGD
jgi:hypothetical protein